MKWLKLELPDKVFGLDTSLLTIFAPTLVIIVVAILSVGWIISPRIDDYTALKSKIKQVEDKTKTLSEKINYLKTIDMEQLAEDEKLINNALLPQKNSYLLVNIIRKLSEKFSYSVESFSVSLTDMKESEESETKSGYDSIPVEVKLIGSADNYIGFISEMEESLPLMSLKKFDIRKSGNMVELDLTISAYYSASKSKVDIAKLTLTDLTLSQTEGDLVARMSGFKPIEDMELIEGKLKLDSEYIQYQREDPFTL